MDWKGKFSTLAAVHQQGERCKFQATRKIRGDDEDDDDDESAGGSLCKDAKFSPAAAAADKTVAVSKKERTNQENNKKTDVTDRGHRAENRKQQNRTARLRWGRGKKCCRSVIRRDYEKSKRTSSCCLC